MNNGLWQCVRLDFKKMFAFRRKLFLCLNDICLVLNLVLVIIKSMKVINAKLNKVFAIYLAMLPIILSLLDVFDMESAIHSQIVLWAIFYCACLMIGVLRWCLKSKSFKISFKQNPLFIITLIMFLWIILSSIINNSFDLNLVIYLSYFLIFVCIYNLDKRWIGIFLNTLIIVMSIICIMGFVGVYVSIKGFPPSMALNFNNPNYVAYIISALAIVCFIKINKSSSKLWKVFYLITYLIFITHLFANGSFVPITALIVLEIVIQIVFGIKLKRIQLDLLLLSLILVPTCLLVDLLPNISSIRTCKYNYFLECVAVFDNIFNTHILGASGVQEIAGSDGWDRLSLIKQSFKYIFSSFKVFIFGGGAGKFYDLRPHNAILSLAIDFGVIMPILVATFGVMTIIKMIKQKTDVKQTYLLFALITMLLCYMFGSIVPNSFYVFAIMLAIFFKQLNNN